MVLLFVIVLRYSPLLCYSHIIVISRNVLVILVHRASSCNSYNSLSYREHAVHSRFLPRCVCMGDGPTWVEVGLRCVSIRPIPTLLPQKHELWYNRRNQAQNTKKVHDIYILIGKAQRKSNQILIGLSILHHVSHLIFNFMPNELLSVKI